jgi:hypothetical protein
MSFIISSVSITIIRAIIILKNGNETEGHEELNRGNYKKLYKVLILNVLTVNETEDGMGGEKCIKTAQWKKFQLRKPLVLAASKCLFI